MPLSTTRFPIATVVLGLVLLGIAYGVPPTARASQADRTPAKFPARVLITNDNGIDDPKIVALARAFAPLAETWVVAPTVDRSGSGSFITVTRRGTLSVERRELGPGINAYAVDGFPGDCVVLALLGLMKDNPPDLVVSGINGGANLGVAWIGSGTVGAARIAALAGVPAIAVSGLDDDQPDAVEAAVSWVVRMAGSDVVRNMAPLEYLTVSLPLVMPDRILGIQVTDRAPLRIVPRLEAASATTWSIVRRDELASTPPVDSDEAAWNAGYIVVVPMRVDEVDLGRLAQWRRKGVLLPRWEE